MRRYWRGVARPGVDFKGSPTYALFMDKSIKMAEIAVVPHTLTILHKHYLVSSAYDLTYYYLLICMYFHLRKTPEHRTRGPKGKFYTRGSLKGFLTWHSYSKPAHEPIGRNRHAIPTCG